MSVCRLAVFLVLALGRAPAGCEEADWIRTTQGQTWTVRPSTPSYDGDTGLYRLSSAYTLPKRHFSFGLFRDNYDRVAKAVDFSIHGLSGALGVSDRLELFGQVGIENRTKANDLEQPANWTDTPAVTSRWQTGLGDLRLGFKLNLRDDRAQEDLLGVALKGVVKFGTADPAKGLGNGKTALAGDVILSKSLRAFGDAHAALGYEWTSSTGERLSDAVRWAIGINLPGCGTRFVQGEVNGRIYMRDGGGQSNTVDGILGVVASIAPQGWYVRPAVSYAAAYRVGSFAKRIGFHLSVGLHAGTFCCARPPWGKVVPKETLR